MNRLQVLAARLHQGLEAIAVRGKPHVERLLGRLPSKEEGEAVDFSTDADVVILRQEPLRARVLLRSIGIAPPRDLFTRHLHLEQPARRG